MTPLATTDEPIGVPLPHAARRRVELPRRSAAVFALLLPVLALALIAAYLAAWFGWFPVAAAPPSGLPTSVVDAPRLTADVRKAPLTSALVMFNGRSQEDPDRNPLVFVGAGNAYRGYGPDGWGSLLSPDGRRVLVPDWSSGTSQHTKLLALSSGAVRTIGSGVPLAWSTNGRYAVLAEYTEDTLHAVTVLDVVSGGVRDHFTIDAPNERANRAALSPDNTSVAIGYASGIAVYRDGVQRWRSGPISGSLAGPAAWTPDGSGVVVLHGDGTLDALDARDGSRLASRTLPALPAAYLDSAAIAHGTGAPARLVSWVSGAPVVATDRAVLALGESPTVLVTGPAAADGDTRDLQVATAALSLPQVPAGSPQAGPLLARSWPLLRFGGPLALLLAVFAERHLLRRLGILRRRRSTSDHD